MSNSNATTQCEQDFLILVEAALSRDLWALKLFDSWGKPLPSGVLKGNMLWTGNYDECLDSLYQPANKTFLSQPFVGQYCTLSPSDTISEGTVSSGLTLGICVPSSCDRQSIVRLARNLFKKDNITENNLLCSNDGATLLSATPQSIFIAQFSAIRTLRRIFTMKKKDDDNSLAFIHGLRVLSLFWVIFGHSILFNLFYTNNVIDVLSWSHNIAFQLISNGVLSVDTFFVISGFLTAIIFVREITKEKLSFRFLIRYYIHRYIRLTPTFLLVLLVSINLTAYFGRGPIYPSIQGFESEGCRQHGWWTAILYVGNLVHVDDMCLGVSWYLYNDMQFHWIAPLALIPFVIGRKSIGYFVTTIYVLIGIGSIVGILLYYPNMSLSLFADATNVNGPSFFNKIYIAPWCRISAYAIGLLTGFILINTGHSYRSNTFPICIHYSNTVALS
ncbi:unnamed protein product [Rotaria sordida]|uniref:Nose resistant-to-fluoxetine protein N-terminal domain-containing protein n=1 Tax=Rotaria sordida TaxID=392033 RepID=A0A819AHF7_9BILA|nr:unnamed protein product [Rotaria sordida]